MANISEPTEEERQSWAEWVASRPDNIRTVAERFDPWKLYRLKSSGHRCTIYSFNSDDRSDAPVSLSVDVTGEFNKIAFARRVFGIDPEDLEECELPAAGEPLGVEMDDAQAADWLARKREVRGDFS